MFRIGPMWRRWSRGIKVRPVVVETGTWEATIANIKKSTEYGSVSNGMKYALLKKPVKGDKISANFLLSFGDERRLNVKYDITAQTASMLNMGTTSRSKKEINDQLDKLKSSVTFVSGGGSAVSINVVTDKDNCMATLDLVADMLLHPAFDSNEFTKLLIDRETNIDENRTNPQAVAITTCRQKMTAFPKRSSALIRRRWMSKWRIARQRSWQMSAGSTMTSTGRITGVSHLWGILTRRRSRDGWRRKSRYIQE